MITRRAHSRGAHAQHRQRRIFLQTALVLIGLLMIGAPLPAAGAAQRPLSLGFDTWADAETPTDLANAASDGASIVRVDVPWSSVAPALAPPGFVASDPASPGYDWSSADQAVREVTAEGITVAMTIYDAPVWAEGPDPPSTAEPGSWRPNASDLAQFATAAALRYDGSFPDPLNPGRFLPAVHVWQAWNEPNLDYYLSPQSTTGPGNTSTPVSPGVYRSLLDGFYSAVKRVSALNRVIMAGTAPYGQAGSDPPGQRTSPLTFYRELVCLTRALKPYPCPSPVYLDGVDHHAYDPVADGPTWSATNPNDVSIPDMHKITAVLNAALAVGNVLPLAQKSVWVSEMGWSTNPPNPNGVPVAQDALWYEEAFYLLWKQGVDTIMPTEIRDQPVNPHVFQNGLYYIDGTPKPQMITAYSFPFVTQRLDPEEIQAWGRAPQAGSLAIQVLRDGAWITLRSLSVGFRQVFSTAIPLQGAATLRAQVSAIPLRGITTLTLGSQASLNWYQSG